METVDRMHWLGRIGRFSGGRRDETHWSQQSQDGLW